MKGSWRPFLLGLIPAGFLLLLMAAAAAGAPPLVLACSVPALVLVYAWSFMEALR